MVQKKKNFRNLDSGNECQIQSSKVFSEMLLVHILPLLHNPDL